MTLSACDQCKNTDLKVRVASEGWKNEQYIVQTTYFYWCEPCQHGYYTT